MAFHPKHMEAGIKAALKSPKTPAHLKPHLQARLSKPVAEVQKPKPMPKVNKSKPDPFNPFYGGY